MDSRITLTESELLDALRRAAAESQQGEEGFTTAELREALGWGEKKVRAALHRLKAQGLIVPVKVRRETLNGTIHPQPGYRLVDRAA